MPGFNLITSNRLEHLITTLADVVQQPLSSPFTPEIIIVQNRGMERLLSLRLSEILGIWAHCEYPFPMAFIQSLFKKAVPNLPERLAFDPECLPWKIMAMLPELRGQELYSVIDRYLENADSAATFQLCNKIADQFDRYTVYRSSLVKQWQLGDDDHWQADLWRRLSYSDIDNRVQIGTMFIDHVLHNTLPEQILPERLSFFGVSTLPPFHLEILHALSTKTDIYYFLLNPCAEYWDDIASDKVITKRLQKIKKQKKNISSATLHFEQGNPLLASMGKYGQEFIRTLHGLEVDEFALPEDPGEHSMLRVIQSDILHLRNRGDSSHSTLPISTDDHSIQLHSCHSVMREIEILYDQLLDMFRTTPDLTPSDIVVMTPDINVYASAIEAVFGSGGDHHQIKLPYSLSDRSGNGANRINSLFLMLLAVPNSRFTVTSILELLDFEEVREAFSLTEQHCDMLIRWIQDTSIRWSIDGAGKEDFDCPPYDENTWKRGIEQLILGYALPPEQDRSFNGMFGYEHIEGTMAQPLGNFLSFFDALVELDSVCKKEHTLSKWADILLSMIDKCIAPDDQQEKEITALRGAVGILKEIETSVGFCDPVDYDLIRNKLTADLNSQVLDRGFFNGAITFCSMLPMRGIPFRVICCIGMGDAAFPRKSTFTTWDLIASNPQPQDRSLEQEDRYLFLEALCSARDIFYISFIKDPRGKSSGERQSVVVDELLDYCERAFFVPDTSSETAIPAGEYTTSTEREYLNNTPSDKAPLEGAHEQSLGNVSSETNDISSLNTNSYSVSISDRIICRHRLQAFHPAYFSGSQKRTATDEHDSSTARSDNVQPVPDSSLFSYSRENLQAAQSLVAPKVPERPFMDLPLIEPDTSLRTITIADLLKFFSNPADFFLTRRLGVGIQRSVEALADEEPFDLQGLEKYQFADTLIENALKRTNPDHFFKHETARGKLPHGTTGEYHFAKLSSETALFIEEIQEVASDYSNKEQAIVLDLDPYTITGSLTNVSHKGVLHFRYADAKAVDRLKLWIPHLIVCIEKSSPILESTLICRDGTWRYASVQDPEQCLRNLCDLYWEGLTRPLHFFPESSWVFAHELLSKKADDEKALRSAAKTWFGSDFSPVTPEREKAGNSLFFKDLNPLDQEFTDLAVGVFGPMINSAV